MTGQKNYTIAMLWVQGRLSYVEQLCIQSFIDNGHPVRLYHYGPVENIPNNVEVVHGDAVLKQANFLQHRRTQSFALFSDVFRYHLLAKNNDVIWADTDAYCHKPFRTETGHFFGWESGSHINGGVLGLPQDSDALGQLLEMTNDEYYIPEWYTGGAGDKMRAARDAGNPVHVSDLPWGVWGPHAITHFLKKTGEDKYAFAIPALYPVPFARRRFMGKVGKRVRVDRWITDETISIHLYGQRIRAFLSQMENGKPEEGSLIDHLIKKHNIDMDAALIGDQEANKKAIETAA